MDESRAALEAVRAALEPPNHFEPRTHFLPVQRMREVMRDDDHPHTPVMRNGVTQSPEGLLYIATAVKFPGCRPEALAWWFSEGCPDDDSYRKWHPEDHASGHWVKTTGPGTSFEEPRSSTADDKFCGATSSPRSLHLTGQLWVGREHRVVEALGARLPIVGTPAAARSPRFQELRIKFRHPERCYGVSQSDLEAGNCELALTARICVKDKVWPFCPSL